jgi:hypothetical protein
VREDEEIARRLVEVVLGVPVRQYDTNSGQSVPDLRISYPDGRRGYVEVFGDPAREEWRELSSVVRRRSGESSTLALRGCKYDWWVYITLETEVKELAVRLPDLLRQLDQAGELFEQRIDPTLRKRNLASPVGAVVIRELRVERIVAGPPAQGEAAVHLVLPNVSGPADVDSGRLIDWSAQLLRSPATEDVRRKLAETDAEERHAFVIAGWGSEWAVLHALSPEAGTVLPDRAPELPPEVTHLWLLGKAPADRLITWSPACGWADYHQRARSARVESSTSCGE